VRLEYGEIFTQRGDAYHGAMLRHPHARDAEFARLFEGTPAHTGQRVLDLPSGGGYLRRWLPDDVEVLCLELTHGFGNDVPVYDPAQPWPHGSFDHAVCLAALHHIEDQSVFLRTLLTRLHPRGTLHLADVARGSGVARFLDGFVGRYNVTGHEGSYLAADPAWFAKLGSVIRLGELACPWHFTDEARMLEFCAGLFGVIDCPPTALREALGDLVGFRHVEGEVVVDWRLLYVDIQAA
jgi:SAM-dependent methyltransferase